MNSETSILVISPSPRLHSTVLDSSAVFGDSIQVLNCLNVSEGLMALEKLDVKSDRLQIYLDSKYSNSEALRLLRILDQEYPRVSRRMVILTDDASNISGIVNLALANCVGDVLNYPILKNEVKTSIKKQFPQLQETVHS